MVCVLGVLTIATLSFQSYTISQIIQSVSMNWGITRTFAGAVLLPVATQASSHVTSVRQTLNQSVLFGMVSQVSRSISLVLIVAPILVLVSWILSAVNSRSLSYDESLALDFGVVPVVIIIVSSVFHVFVSTVGVHVLITDETSNPNTSGGADDDEDSLGGSSASRNHHRSIVWLIGAALFTLYLIVVIVFFYHP